MALTTIGTHCSNLPNGTRNSLRMLSIALVKLSLHVRFKSVQFLIFGRNTLRFCSTPIFTQAMKFAKDFKIALSNRTRKWAFTLVRFTQQAYFETLQSRTINYADLP
jgi:hypothetical protein